MRQSGTGKTLALARLACEVREKKESPVLLSIRSSRLPAVDELVESPNLLEAPAELNEKELNELKGLIRDVAGATFEVKGSDLLLPVIIPQLECPRAERRKMLLE